MWGFSLTSHCTVSFLFVCLFCLLRYKVIKLRWWYTVCYYSFRHSTFNDIHDILVAHVVYTRPQNLVTKSSVFAYTVIA